MAPGSFLQDRPYYYPLQTDQEPQHTEEPGGYGQKQGGRQLFQLQPDFKVTLYSTVSPDASDKSIVVYTHHTDEGTEVQEKINRNQRRPQGFIHEPGHPWKAEIVYKAM